MLFHAETSTEKRGKYMSNKHEPLPQFNNEDEEQDFWSTHDSTDYIDWSKAEKNPAFPNLKPSTRTISIRLPESLIMALKTIANKRDIPYQSLVKMYLYEKVKEESLPYHSHE